MTLVLSATAVPMLAAAVVILILGSVGVARDRASPVTISFLVLTACASWWLASASLMMMSVQPEATLIWARIVYVGVALLPAAIVQFAFALVEKLRERSVLLAIVWTVSALFATLFATTDLFIAGIYRYDWGSYARLSLSSGAFLIFLGIALVGSVVTLTTAIVTTLSGQQKRRASSFLVALVVGYVGAIDFLPSFGVDILPLGYIAVFGFVALSIHAMHRDRLVDLSPSFVAEQLLDAVQGGVIVVDLRGVIRLANPAAAGLLGDSPESLEGKSLQSLVRRPLLPTAQTGTLARVGRTRNKPMTWTRSDGHSVEVSVSATLLRDHQQLPAGILYVLSDLADTRRAERHEFAAHHDALTGIPNRAYFEKRFTDRVDDIVRQRRTAAVLFLDLDGFKRVNDEHGHAVGDRLLQLVASRLSNALRTDDILSRYGGDEFVVLLNLREAADARVVAEKLLRVLREPFAVDALTLRVGASIGVSIASRDGTEMDDLVRAADQAMYRAKRGVPSGPRPASDSVAPSPFSAESRA